MLSIVIPALNEERTVGICVRKAINSIRKLNIEGEVVVADNGSVDNTGKVAIEAGARVIKVEEKGYGAAYRNSIPRTEGDFIIIGDGDDSYNFEEIEPFYRKLEEGYEFVMGNRSSSLRTGRRNRPTPGALQRPEPSSYFCSS